MRITDFQHKWQRISEVADRVVSRHQSPEVDANEQTGSGIVLNCTVQTPDGSKSVHGFWLHATGAHVVRLVADPAALSSVAPGRNIIDRDAGVWCIKRVEMSACGAWIVASLCKLL